MGLRRGGVSLCKGRGGSAGRVDSLEHGNFTSAVLEALAVRGWDVEVAAQDVVDVLALQSGELTPAGSEAEAVKGHEVGPLLDKGGLTSPVGLSSGVNDSSNGVRAVVLAVRVHLSSGVTVDETHGGEVSQTSHLDIVGCGDKVHTSEGAVGNQTGSVGGLGAVSDGCGEQDKDSGLATVAQQNRTLANITRHSPLLSKEPTSSPSPGGPQRQKSSTELSQAVWQDELAFHEPSPWRHRL